MKNIACCMLSLACALPLVAQRNFDDVQVTATQVAGSVYMLTGSGGNIGVSVGADGILMVDDQFAPLANKIRAALAPLGQGPIKFLLNTHFHGDHTGGNEVFGKEAAVIAHTNVRQRLAQQQQRGDRSASSKPKEALPVLTFDAAVSFHFNGEEIKAVHYPRSHTDGDIVIFFTGSNVVHMGDMFFNGRFPFVDLNSGGSVQGLAASIGAIIKELPADVKLIPGHGKQGTLDELKQYHAMLTECIGIVREHITKGKDVDAVKAAGLPKKWSGWGGGFISEERWLETLYKDLGGTE